ncbi:hypothetical protein C2S51_027811 [Perilla frutescens var. frutescens]|nr:hypothetical protein C2S51_027811 [Perilla frutescens var. frutescens]
MVRSIPILDGRESFSAIPLALGLFVSVSILVGLCAKHARQSSRKCGSKTRDPNTAAAKAASVLPSPKKLIATISHKAMTPLVHGKKSAARPESDAGVDGESGLWQKAIMLGEKCQPPEFSGVIYYDYDGNRIPEMPKSPRHTSMTPLKTFGLPVHKNENSIY